MSVVQTGYVYHLKNSFVLFFVCLFGVMEGWKFEGVGWRGGGVGDASGGDDGCRCQDTGVLVKFSLKPNPSLSKCTILFFF